MDVTGCVTNHFRQLHSWMMIRGLMKLRESVTPILFQMLSYSKTSTHGEA